jgi:hypothetical protein
MKITIESTAHLVDINRHQGDGPAVPARVWQGQTEGGIPIYAFVTRIAVRADQDLAQFERELVETPPMQSDLRDLFPRGIPARLVLG